MLHQLLFSDAVLGAVLTQSTETFCQVASSSTEQQRSVPNDDDDRTRRSAFFFFQALGHCGASAMCSCLGSSNPRKFSQQLTRLPHVSSPRALSPFICKKTLPCCDVCPSGPSCCCLVLSKAGILWRSSKLNAWETGGMGKQGVAKKLVPLVLTCLPHPVHTYHHLLAGRNYLLTTKHESTFVTFHTMVLKISHTKKSNHHAFPQTPKKKKKHYDQRDKNH